MRSFLLSLLLALAIGGALRAQPRPGGVVQGTLSSLEDHEALAGATVLLEGTVLGTTTDASGKFEIKAIPPGQYSLNVSMIGFRRKVTDPLSISGGDTLRLQLELEPAPVQTPPVVVTASKREESLQDVPVSVSVIDDRMLAMRNSITVDDALRYVPGVNITQSQVNIRGSTGYSHGIGSRVLLLVDGLPFLSGDTGEIIWESLPPSEIDRVEVVKGAGSALYGSSALGGVINIVTRTAQERPETRVRMYGGMYQMPTYATWDWSGSGRAFSGISASHLERFGPFSLSVGGSRTLDDGYKRNDYWRRWNVWMRTGYDLSPFQTLSLSFSLLDQNRGNFLYWQDLDHALEPPGDELSQHIQSDRWNLAGSYKHYLSGDLFYVARIGWYRSQWTDNLPSRFDSAGSHSRSDFVTGDVQVTGRISDRQILTGGISGVFNNVNADTIFGSHTSRGGAMYLQDEIRVTDPLRVTAGGRFDLQQLESLPEVSQFNPKIGAVYTISPSSTIRASAGRGFRAPSIAEVFTTTEAGGLVILPDSTLKPERSWSFELGGTGTFGENLSLELSLFRNELWDLIEPAFAADGYVHFQNITRARITGAEMVADITLLRRTLTCRISYTIMDPEDLTAGDVLKYRSRNLFYVSAQAAVDPVRVGFDLRYLSKYERIDEELVTLGIVPDGDARVPITVADIRAGVNWTLGGRSFTASFNVNNLFQYYYVDFIGNLGPTRNYVLTLEATL